MATVQREVELKLEISPGDLARLRRHARVRELSVGRATTRTLRSVYFDTPDLALARRDIGLRLRWADGQVRPIQTLKTRAASGPGLFERDEFECRVDGDRPDLDALTDAALRRRLRRLLKHGALGPVFETRMRRTSRLLRDGRHEWTLDLDAGEVRAAAAREPFCEVELELRRGDARRLYDFALELAQTIALLPDSRSKADRGYALLPRASPRREGPRRVALRRDQCVGEALHGVLRGTLDQMMDSARLALAGESGDAVPQLRGAALRLCSALDVFDAALPQRRAAALRREMRWLAGELGAIYEFQRVAEKWIAPALRAPGHGSAARPMCRELQVLCGEHRATLCRVLRGTRFARLVLASGCLLAGGAAARGSRRALRAQSAAPFAAAKLAHCRREAERVAMQLSGAAASERSVRRVHVELLRHEFDLLRHLYPDRAACRSLARLAQLGRALGCAEDAAAAQEILDRLVSGSGRDADSGCAAVAAGKRARRAQRRAEARLPALAGALRRTPASGRPR